MNTSPTGSELHKSLVRIWENEAFSIRAAVAQQALYYANDEIVSFFSDLLNFGCKSGMVGALIYYHDTALFFDKHYHEIEGLRLEFEENTGESFKIESDLKNTLAWFAFEETAYQMAIELGLEI